MARRAGLYIISLSDSNQPAQLYLLNTNTSPNTLSLFANTYPALDTKTLSKPETLVVVSVNDRHSTQPIANNLIH